MWNRRGGEYMKRKLNYNPESRASPPCPCRNARECAPHGVCCVAVAVVVVVAGPRAANNDPGEFWMKFEDFHQQFATVFVCRLLREWNTPAQATGNWYGGSRG